MISRRRRTEALVESNSAVAIGLAVLVCREAEVIDLARPRQGLVMCEVCETARGSRFYLGEALMSESRVRIGETEGLGVVLGSDAELARALAVVDAACALLVPLACAGAIEEGIASAEHDLAARRVHEAALTGTSRVSFDTMGGQDMSVQVVAR